LKNKRGIIFCDPVAPTGHLTINKFYIDTLSSLNDTFYVSNTMLKHFNHKVHCISFNADFLKKGRFAHWLYTLFISLKCMRHAKNAGHIVYFLSYDIGNLFILTFWARLSKVKIVVFEHNTVPGNSKAKQLLQRLCVTKNLFRLCYTGKMANQFIGNTFLIPHPILINKSLSKDVDLDFLTLKKKYNTVVFCPSASASVDKVIDLASKMLDVLFVFKSEKINPNNNIYTQKYFDNYNFFIENADFIYLPIESDDRVSGPLFEAICANKKVLVDTTDFGITSMELFPDNVQFVEDKWQKASLTFNVEVYNQSIVSQLKRLFCE
jgi:hypothetical protein